MKERRKTRRNVTVTLDEDTARWARVEAARQNTSVSRFLRDLLREQMRQEDDYRSARERFLGREPYLKPVKGRRLPSRDEIHDRGAPGGSR